MKASQFLGYCARRFDADGKVDWSEGDLLSPHRRFEAAVYLVRTFPVSGDEFSPRTRQARVLGFLLAAEMARSDGY